MFCTTVYLEGQEIAKFDKKLSKGEAVFEAIALEMLKESFTLSSIAIASYKDFSVNVQKTACTQTIDMFQ